MATGLLCSSALGSRCNLLQSHSRSCRYACVAYASAQCMMACKLLYNYYSWHTLYACSHTGLRDANPPDGSRSSQCELCSGAATRRCILNIQRSALPQAATAPRCAVTTWLSPREHFAGNRSVYQYAGRQQPLRQHGQPHGEHEEGAGACPGLCMHHLCRLTNATCF
jgi:hypothetical protein